LFVMSLGLNGPPSVVETAPYAETSPDYPAKYRGRVPRGSKSVAAPRRACSGRTSGHADAAADRDAREKNKYFAQAID